MMVCTGFEKNFEFQCIDIITKIYSNKIGGGFISDNIMLIRESIL